MWIAFFFGFRDHCSKAFEHKSQFHVNESGVDGEEIFGIYAAGRPRVSN
jgi:hypothetical protein